MKKIRIFIADDHAFVRMGISSLLETESDLAMVGEAADGEEAVAEIRRLQPDIAILDLMMPKKDGVAVTREILAHSSPTRVIIITSFASADGLAQAIEAGAAGVVMKNEDSTRLVEAIRTVAAGGQSIPDDLQREIARHPPVPPLSSRQSEVLTSMVNGATNREIAAQLGISVDRVEEHVAVLMDKLGAANRTEAVAITLRKHLLKI